MKKSILISQDEDYEPGEGYTYKFECKTDIMSSSEFLAAMETIKNDEREGSYTETKHIAADNLCLAVLESLGYQQGVKVFRSLHKWYS